MTIRNPELHAAATVDWSPLRHELKRGTAIIDVDGSHDCNGHILVLEAKPHGYVWLSGGQLSHLRAYAAREIDVLVVYLRETGDVTSVSGYHVIHADRPLTPKPELADFAALQALLAEWTADHQEPWTPRRGGACHNCHRARLTQKPR